MKMCEVYFLEVINVGIIGNIGVTFGIIHLVNGNNFHQTDKISIMGWKLHGFLSELLTRCTKEVDRYFTF